jgi:SAM-dependent methyltransferase
LIENIYTTGEYLEKNPTWHIEHSPWKAKQIMRMLAQNDIVPKTVCEVGCGAGEILKQLQENMEHPCTLWGYEISQQAFDLCKSRENERLHFKLADFLQEKDPFFDLILLIDIIEHLEDYFSFLRDLKPKSQYKILHIPLDLTLRAIVRRELIGHRKHAGHLHYFTQDIALQMLKEVGYEVLDHFYTPIALEIPAKATPVEVKRQLLFLPRKIGFTIRRDLAVRLFGGWSLLVLAK